ncbi:MAG TPA: hypothetical protein PK858_01385, partial [Saprospiraceae bacterium]|nr:hypothetical protein [Saprospiraceae bacterium]
MPPPTNFLMAVLLWLAFVLPAFSQPINDDCAGAIPLTVHGDLNCYYPQSVLTTGSTPSLPASTCMDKGDVWFRFKAVQSTHHLALQQATSALTGDVLPVQIELFSGACGNLNSFDCWADVRQYSNNTLKIHSLQPGQTYYVRVAQPDDIPIRLSMCLLTPPPPPVNDECASAVELMPASSGVSCALVSGTTHHATRSLGVPAPPCCESGDVWYRFTAAAYAHELTLNSEWWKHGANPYVRVRAEVFSGSNCQTFTPLGAVSAGYYFSNTAYLINLTPGATYWVRVYAEDDTDANFNICVTTPRAPDNDECDAALPFPVNEGLDRNQFFSISGYAASPSALPSGCSNKAVNDTWYAFTATTERYRFEIYKAYTEGGPMNLEILSGDCAQPTSLMCRSSDENYVVFEQGGFTPGSTYYVRTWCSGFLKQSIFGVALALPAPPPNDECAQAILLPANSPLPCTATVTGTTLAASTSLNDCDGKAVQDVWYRFTAEGTSNLLQINALKGYFDYPGLSGFEVLEGTDCADASSVFCQNDLQNRINWVLPELKTGHTYLLRLFSQALRAQDFSLCLSVLGQPANDRCTSATEVLVNPDLGCSWSVAGSLAGATGESVPEQSDVWYQFTALHSVHLIHLRDVVVLYGSTGYLRCQVYAGAACDGGTLVSEFDPTTTMHVEGLVPGAAYALRVFSLDPDMAYRFDLCIRSLPPAPSNISCASAAPLTINPDLSCAQVLHGTTAGTPGKVGYGLGCSISWWERPIHELWYSFTALTSTHRIELSGVKAVTGFDSGRFAWSVLNSDDCVAFDNSLACGEGEGKALLRNLTPGRTYYILISSDYDDVAHDFDLCVSTYPAPANDDCIHATVLTVSADAGCQNVVSGTLVSASPSPEALLCGSPQNDVWYTFTATGPAHTVYVTKPFIAPAEVSIYQTFSVAVYGGADCSQLKPLACGSPMYYSAYMSLGDLVPGMQYWV